MSFNRDELDAIEAWTATAKPLSAIYYRSVEYRFMDPKEVLSGRGAALYGGRFASVGTPAVFLAESDSAASEEVLARKRRLGGSAQITLDKYPRIVFGVAVSLDRVLDLSKRGLPKAIASVRQSCLAPTISFHRWNEATSCGREPSKGSSFPAPLVGGRT